VSTDEKKPADGKAVVEGEEKKEEGAVKPEEKKNDKKKPGKSG